MRVPKSSQLAMKILSNVMFLLGITIGVQWSAIVENNVHGKRRSAPNEYSMELFRLFLRNNSVYSACLLGCRPCKTESCLIFCQKASPKARQNPPCLAERVRNVVRFKHYSLRTERTYCDWIEHVKTSLTCRELL